MRAFTTLPTLLAARTTAPLAVAVAVAALLGPAAAGAQAPSHEAIEYPPLPPLEIPEPTRAVLDNGMVVLMLEDHELPLVDAVALVRTGERWQPADRLGLAEIAAEALRTGGTESMPADELDDWLEGKAASIESFVTTELGQVRMSSLAEDFEEVLGVFADVLRRPAFAEDRIDLARNQLASGIARQNDNPQGILFREIAQVVYGEDSPYARQPTYATVGAVDRDDVVEWHRRWYRPDRVILGLAGDFDAETALAAIESTFGDWRAEDESEEPEAGWKERPSPGVYRVEKDDMTQSNIAMAHLGIRRDHPDIYAVEVMNEVLSGGASSRLFANVRTRKGLAYGVSGSIGSDFDHPGLALLWMTTKTETTGAGIEALLEEARGMTASPPTGAEVAKAKDSILNSFVFNFDSAAEVLTQKLTYEYFDYPADLMERYRRGIEAVTVEDVRRVAAELLHPERFAILVVGPGEGLDRPLSAFGEVHPVDITIPEPPAEEIAVSAEDEAHGAELVARAVEGLGGAAAVDAVSALRVSGNASQVMPQGEVEVGLEVTYRYPDSVRQEVELPFGRMAMVVAPDAAFAVTPQGIVDLPAARADSMRRAIKRLPLMALKDRDDRAFRAAVLGEGEVDGVPVTRLLVETDGLRTTFGVDPDTGRVLSAEYRGEGPTGAPGQVREAYSDFRSTGGLTLPHATARHFEGDPVGGTVLDEIVVDPDIDPAAFERPADEETTAAPTG